jgi:threonine synthase
MTILGEGNTPLIEVPRLSEELGIRLHVKCESLNPTGSFKDRGMAVAVGRAVERGAHTVVCASTGNTAASAAAYAARFGVRAVVLTPKGATAGAKRAQARAVGALVLELDGTFDDALRCCRELAEQDGFVLVISVYPDRLDGQATVVSELVEQLGAAPDVIALPYGGGGNSSAIALGIERAGLATTLLAGEARERPTTFASAIRIGEPAHAVNIARLRDQGRLEVVTLTEDEIRTAWLDLARSEGVFCEPASAAGIAALRRVRPPTGASVVCVVTGHGLKDPGAVPEDERAAVTPNVGAIMEAIS